MTGEAIVLMVVTLTIVWGGLIAAIAFLRSRPEREDLPEGGEDAPDAPTGTAAAPSQPRETGQ